MATKKKTTKDMFIAVADACTVIDLECGDSIDLACVVGTLAEAVEAASNEVRTPIDGDEDKVSVVIYKLVPVKTVKRAAILVEDV